MRLLGGFTGGIWPAHWVSDLGAGRFDGAWLVQNFEALQSRGRVQEVRHALRAAGD